MSVPAALLIGVLVFFILATIVLVWQLFLLREGHRELVELLQRRSDIVSSKANEQFEKRLEEILKRTRQETDEVIKRTRLATDYFRGELEDQLTTLLTDQRKLFKRLTRRLPSDMKRVSQTLAAEMSKHLTSSLQQADRDFTQTVAELTDRFREELVAEQSQRRVMFEQRLREVIPEILGTALRRSLSAADQERLLLAALEEAKRRKLFE